VSLIEDGFAMAATAEMSVKLRFRLGRDLADIAVLGASNFSREAGLVTTARQVLAVDDGLTALDLADAAAFLAARNRRARMTVMVLAGRCSPTAIASRQISPAGRRVMWYSAGAGTVTFTP
jgi:hypothetical protein